MSNGSTEQMKITAGMDLGDYYSHLCLIDTEDGEVIEESRLSTTPEAIRRRFDSERPLHVAIEVGTHSPWISRLLTECGQEVLIANPRKTRLIYAVRWRGRRARPPGASDAKAGDRRGIAGAGTRGSGRALGPRSTVRARTLPLPMGESRDL